MIAKILAYEFPVSGIHMDLASLASSPGKNIGQLPAGSPCAGTLLVIAWMADLGVKTTEFSSFCPLNAAAQQMPIGSQPSPYNSLHAALQHNDLIGSPWQ